MIRFIHLTHQFEKQLSAMKRSSKMAVAASRKADAIINRLAANGMSPLNEAGKLSHHGERRIRHAVKFDIGKGYRMLAVKKNEQLYLLFVGAHDNCAAWVENNRGLENPGELTRIRTLTAALPRNEPPAGPDLSPEPDYDDLLLARVTEQDLCVVFQGLRRRNSE
ncbi:hypothetical protein [Desulfoluna spongiiphila]|uniref:Uncharacterized protein n=1 Tax=Desulfoluna spongiiphila TaxID=419481 RepID=A0A1G5FDF6_9BACT|nr:hypothetical protein [Desulfoluna spongiiphila]SCY37243.1 hypothetical protein SAMN05216233_1084 [Desulfoluna spongiiphila]VVS95660.1 hypothetical protein DBB_52370 [Desulfoluna spongiiphila]